MNPNSEVLNIFTMLIEAVEMDARFIAEKIGTLALEGQTEEAHNMIDLLERPRTFIEEIEKQANLYHGWMKGETWKVTGDAEELSVSINGEECKVLSEEEEEEEEEASESKEEEENLKVSDIIESAIPEVLWALHLHKGGAMSPLSIARAIKDAHPMVSNWIQENRISSVSRGRTAMLRNKLRKRGFITNANRLWIITPLGREEAKKGRHA